MSPVRKKMASPYHILSSPHPPPSPNITAELMTLAFATGSYVRKRNMPSPSRYLSMVRCAGSKPPACFSRIVHAGTTPFAVRAGTEPIACASACRVMSHNDGHAGTERPACLSRVVQAGTTPFAVHADTQPIACASASCVLSHNDGCAIPPCLEQAVRQMGKMRKHLS